MVAGCVLATLFAAAAAASLRHRGVASSSQRLRHLDDDCAKDGFEYELDKLSWEVSGSRGSIVAKQMVGWHPAPVGPNDTPSAMDRAAARLKNFYSAAYGGHTSGVGMRFNSTADGPTYCPHHIPVDAPYWQETEQYHQTNPGYIKCQYSDDCRRPTTNADRVNSIRRALAGTKALFNTLEVEHVLYGGSLIGQHRCGDVLPWDVDCDVLVSSKSIQRIYAEVYGKTLDFRSFQRGETTADLANFGAPGIALATKSGCTPFEVVDTHNGFFCDVFVSDWVDSALYTPWWEGPRNCDGVFPECPGGHTCYAYPSDVVDPVVSCGVAGSYMSCPARTPSFLEITYGPSFNVPNKTISVHR